MEELPAPDLNHAEIREPYEAGSGDGDGEGVALDLRVQEFYRIGCLYYEIEGVEAGESGYEEFSEIQGFGVAQVNEAEDVSREEEKEADGDGEGEGERGEESVRRAMVLGLGGKDGQEGAYGVMVEDQECGEEAQGGERVGALRLGWCERAFGVHCDL